MTFVANQKLAVRLSVAFGALAAGLAIVAAIAFGQIGGLQSTTRDVGEHDLRIQQSTGALARSVATAHGLTADHL